MGSERRRREGTIRYPYPYPFLNNRTEEFFDLALDDLSDCRHRHGTRFFRAQLPVMVRVGPVAAILRA